MPNNTARFTTSTPSTTDATSNIKALPKMTTTTLQPSLPSTATHMQTKVDNSSIGPATATIHKPTSLAAVEIEEYDDDDDDEEEEVGTIGMQVPRYKTTVKLYTGARRALRELVTNPNYKHIVIGVASTSLEPSYSHACIDGIEITKGVRLRDVITYDQIGRSGPFLTSRKTTHFQLLHQESGVPYNEMLFFDDCNWGDHVSDVQNAFGVIGVATPHGLQYSEFEKGLEIYRLEVEKRLGGGKKRKQDEF
uniref:Uncharacterized protein n=1 Tax=Ditylum brightwellii TaxID=49249 RepID=A0A7S1ZWP5_9STRA